MLSARTSNLVASSGGIDEPRIQALLARRSRLRWRFSAILIVAYLVWGVAGVYAPGFYAAPFLGIAMPTGIAMGFAIIILSMVLAVVYVRIVNEIESSTNDTAGSGS